MALDPRIAERLRLPIMSAPMTAVTGPELVVESMKAGIMAGLPRRNAGPLETFESWLEWIDAEVSAYRDAHPEAIIGPLAVNLSSSRPPSDYRPELDLCAKYGVEVIINAMGNPREITEMVHDWGGLLFHDVTTIEHAEKAISAGVDGLTCILNGGGGHSGGLSPFVFIPQVREIFGGTVIAGGAITTGAAVRAAEVLGADLAYLGTRFIASKEARVSAAYHEHILASTAAELLHTAAVTGVPANWMRRSLVAAGIDPDNPPVSAGRGNYDHLPDGLRPWRDIHSAGQGVNLIRDVPTVAELVERLDAEYRAACKAPSLGWGEEN